MSTSFLKSLKSGSDIRGVALENPLNEEVTLTEEVVEAIAVGFWLFLKNELSTDTGQIKVAVGADSRLSSPKIKEIFCKTLSYCGAHIFDCGLSTTPAMFMSTKFLCCHAGVEVTASHHPYHKNGFKFFVKQGGLNSGDITKILENADNFLKSEKLLVATQNAGKIEKLELLKNHYAKDIRKNIIQGVTPENLGELPLRGYKIVVDAGNGATGFFAKEVLERLGADIKGSQFLEPDGRFPNHIPNPEDSKAMESIKKAVLTNKADLGIIFDTDGDRAGAVDCDGNEINKNVLIALASYIALKDNPGATIVTDSVTSDGLTEFIEEKLKGVHHRFKRGYKNVINEAKRLNEIGVNCPLAIETSGHAAMRENDFLDDGAYLVVKLIILLTRLKEEGKAFSHILKDLKQPVESHEFRINITSNDFKNYTEEVFRKTENTVSSNDNFKVEPNNFDGIRIQVKTKNLTGWFLLRASVHDPVLVLNVESNNKIGGVQEILNNLYVLLNKFEHLKLNEIEDYLTLS